MLAKTVKISVRVCCIHHSHLRDDRLQVRSSTRCRLTGLAVATAGRLLEVAEHLIEVECGGLLARRELYEGLHLLGYEPLLPYSESLSRRTRSDRTPRAAP